MEVKCKKCNRDFSFNQTDTEWKSGSGYDVKIVKCPHCGTYKSLKYIEDRALYVNTDERYYR